LARSRAWRSAASSASAFSVSWALRSRLTAPDHGREQPGVFPQGFLGVNAFRNELRSEWLPAPAVKTLAETGAPTWAVEAFDRLRAANGGSLGGFFDVFAWREPGEVRFYEAKVGPDRIKPTQLRFVELALRFHLRVLPPRTRGSGPVKAMARRIASWLRG
jgi:hypothetical protein